MRRGYPQGGGGRRAGNGGRRQRSRKRDRSGCGTADADIAQQRLAQRRRPGHQHLAPRGGLTGCGGQRDHHRRQQVGVHVGQQELAGAA